jgi:hypothetical protein
MGGRLKPIILTGKLDHDRLQLKLDSADFTLDRIKQPADTVRVERIGGLVRAWGSIEFFHPYVAHRPIDWDAALLTAIPKVEAAHSTAEYADAVESMLRQLNDPETRVTQGDARETKPVGIQRRLVRFACSEGGEHGGSTRASNDFRICYDPTRIGLGPDHQFPDREFGPAPARDL